MTAVASPLRREPRQAGKGAKAPTRLEVVGARRSANHVRRARRRHLLACSVVLVVVACLLGLVASHATLAQGQFRLEKLEQKAAEEQAQYERLRLQVAQLESPSRIVAAAQERLGMVPPPGVTYLSPTGASADRPGRGATAEEQKEAATDDWANVKRQLATR